MQCLQVITHGTDDGGVHTHVFPLLTLFPLFPVKLLTVKIMATKPTLSCHLAIAWTTFHSQ